MSSRAFQSIVRLLAFALASVLAASANAAIDGATAATASTVSPLTRDTFVNGLRQEIASHFNLEGDLVVELTRPWSPPARVASSWTVSVVEFPSLANSNMMLRYRLFADGVVAAESAVMVRAMLWRDAWVSRAPLTIGAMFEPALLETRRVDMLRDRDALPASVGDRSYIFARGVAAGHQLTWRDISRRPLVKKGDMVDVSAVDGQLVITMKALAMENGAQGDTVKVRNPDSRRDFAALVVDENRVQVRF